MFGSIVDGMLLSRPIETKSQSFQVQRNVANLLAGTGKLPMPLRINVAGLSRIFRAIPPFPLNAVAWRKTRRCEAMNAAASLETTNDPKSVLLLTAAGGV